MIILKPRDYYNEFDPYAAEWLRILIAMGHLPPGEVDERSIEDVTPVELSGFRQCHFFAGIGIWSAALLGAGWPDDQPVWTGSCPCQPFSSAGKGAGLADERHLWPAFHHLIRECGPGVVFGEQVANGGGLEWLDLIQSDMEATNYSLGALDLCAAGFGAPNIRQRLSWTAERLADADRGERHGLADGEGGERHGTAARRVKDDSGPAGGGASGGLADSSSRHAGDRGAFGSWEHRQQPGDGGLLLGSGRPHASGENGNAAFPGGRPGPVNGFWRNADWIFCRDGKWRAVEPGTFPLAAGDSPRLVALRAAEIQAEKEGLKFPESPDVPPPRAGMLKAYGNALNQAQAEEFIRAYMMSRRDRGLLA